MPSRTQDAAAHDLDEAALREAADAVAEIGNRLPAAAIRALAEEVVARLSRLHGFIDPQHPGAGEIDLLCQALLSEDDDAAARMLKEARQAGATVEAAYLAYLSAAAGRLGEYWTQNRASFLEVTVAVGRIYAIMRGLRRSLRAPLPGQGRAALFAAVPGEGHTLGLTMAADLLRSKGWDIAVLAGASHDEILDAVVSGPHDLIGLSATGGDMLLPLGRLVAAIHVSRPGASILVGGNVTEAEPHLVKLLGVDGIARSVEEGLAELERLRAAHLRQDR